MNTHSISKSADSFQLTAVSGVKGPHEAVCSCPSLSPDARQRSALRRDKIIVAVERRIPRARVLQEQMDHERLVAVLRALEQYGVRYVVFGGIALNLHGLVRATEDVDIFIAADAQNVEALKTALRSMFSDPSIDEISAEDLLGEYPAIQYIPPDGAFHVDILTRLGEAYRYEDLEQQRVPFAGFHVPIVTPRMLYRMKSGTLRLKHRADAETLRRRFGAELD